MDIEKIKIIKLSKNDFDLDSCLDLLLSEREKDRFLNFKEKEFKIYEAFKGKVIFNKDKTIKSYENNDEYVTLITNEEIFSYSIMLLNYCCVNIFNIDSLSECTEKELNVIKQYHLDNENYEILNLIKIKY